MKHLISCLMALLAGSDLLAQMPDAAMQANYLMVEKAGEAYERVDGYRVKGSPYFFGKGNEGTIWQAGAVPTKTTLFYHVYQQKLYIQPPGGGRPETLIPNVDSFEVEVTIPDQGQQTLRFLNGKYLGLPADQFVQVVLAGPRYSLYKQYTMELASSTTNLMESDLRTYELNRGYYLRLADKPAQKLRPAQAALAKAVKPASINGLREVDDWEVNFEAAAAEVVAKLNLLP